jgi:hypothetical protein
VGLSVLPRRVRVVFSSTTRQSEIIALAGPDTAGLRFTVH